MAIETPPGPNGHEVSIGAATLPELNGLAVAFVCSEKGIPSTVTAPEEVGQDHVVVGLATGRQFSSRSTRLFLTKLGDDLVATWPERLMRTMPESVEFDRQTAVVELCRRDHRLRWDETTTVRTPCRLFSSRRKYIEEGRRIWTPE